MPLNVWRSVRKSQPQTTTRLRELRTWVAFNYSNALLPANLSLRIPGVSWGASTNSARAGMPDGSIGLYSTAESVAGQLFGTDRSLDGFSPANSPCWFAWTMQFGDYVNQGSGSNVIWQYGSLDGGVGFWARTNSTNTLLVSLSNTEITGPVLTNGAVYHCVCGRDAAGNCWLWVNGQLVASGTGATAADSAVAYRLFLIGDETASRTFKGKISFFAVGSDNPIEFGAELSKNTYTLFAPTNNAVWFGAGAGGGSNPLDESSDWSILQSQSTPPLISVW